MAAIVPKIRKCEQCGCTDMSPCSGGCSWDPTFESVGRDICSNCMTDDRSEYEAPMSALLLPGDPEFEATILEMRRR